MRIDKKAFTLLELLVSISLIMLLVSFVAVSLRGVRASASRAESLSALRQMTLAYASYSADHNQRLMPGYLDQEFLVKLDITARLPDGTVLDQCDGQICDRSSYVWRLAPYVDNAWQTFYVDLRDAGLLTRLQAKHDQAPPVLGPAGDPDTGGISERPAFGMNSIFVGGDTTHGGSAVTPFHPWNTAGNDSIAATRLSQVKNPSRLILFAPATKVGGDDTVGGFCELRPPFLPDDNGDWTLQQWRIEPGGTIDFVGQATEAGQPVDRSGKGILPVALLDGSSGIEPFANLATDMRRWNPFEVGRRQTQPAP